MTKRKESEIEYLALLLIGLLAGIVGGLLGVGGSILMIPAMMWLFGPGRHDQPQHLYQGAAMIVNLFVALPAVVQHRRNGAILWPIVKAAAPAAVVGVLIGVWLSHGQWFRGANEIRLSRIFGAFLLYVAAYNAYRLFTVWQLPDVTREDADRIAAWRITATVGLPMGLVGGLLGIGGGALAVPFQQVFLRIPLRRAIANSATTIVPLSLIGAIYKNYANTQLGIPLRQSTAIALCLIPTAIIGGFIGGRLTHVLPRKVVRVAFIILLCVGAYGLFRRGPAQERAAQTAPAANAFRLNDRLTTDTAHLGEPLL